MVVFYFDHQDYDFENLISGKEKLASCCYQLPSDLSTLDELLHFLKIPKEKAKAKRLKQDSQPSSSDISVNSSLETLFAADPSIGSVNLAKSQLETFAETLIRQVAFALINVYS